MNDRPPLSGKTALVTGGGRGIGLGCAMVLAQQGASIVLNDRPGSPDLADAAERIRATGATCETMEANVFDRDGCERLVDSIERLDILVSNPAFSRRGTFVDYDPDLFDRTLRGTLASGFHLGQLSARRMIAAGSGKMVFISSVHGEIPLALAVAYNAAKAGLNHMVRTMAVELAPHRINVNAIAPGWIDTPGERETFAEEVITEEGQKLPWGRLGHPEDIGQAAAFLASGAADYITGVVLPVDGGFRFRDCGGDALIRTTRDG